MVVFFVQVDNEKNKKKENWIKAKTKSKTINKGKSKNTFNIWLKNHAPKNQVFYPLNKGGNSLIEKYLFTKYSIWLHLWSKVHLLTYLLIYMHIIHSYVHKKKMHICIRPER